MRERDVTQRFLRDALTWKPIARLYGLREENRNMADNPPVKVVFHRA